MAQQPGRSDGHELANRWNRQVGLQTLEMRMLQPLWTARRERKAPLRHSCFFYFPSNVADCSHPNRGNPCGLTSGLLVKHQPVASHNQSRETTMERM